MENVFLVFFSPLYCYKLHFSLLGTFAVDLLGSIGTDLPGAVGANVLIGKKSMGVCTYRKNCQQYNRKKCIYTVVN